jgi:hypothetical protein
MPSYNTDPDVTPDFSKWTILDYMFAFSYVLAFKGAICYAIWGITNINVTQIFINEKINNLLDICCGLAGFLSIIRWFKLDLTTYIPQLNNFINIGNIIIDSHGMFG